MNQGLFCLFTLLILLNTNKMSLEQFVSLGKEIGLSGDQLLEFVEKKEAELYNRERMENEKKEKLERERLEYEERKEKERLEYEEKKLKEKIEREERARDREMKLKEKELELEWEKTKQGMSGKGAEGSNKARVPKLPSFEDGKDDMDAYLQRYERFANASKWPQKDWAINLSALLRGKALEVYCRMSPSDSQDYVKIKEALLKRYNLTEEGFRNKFRTCLSERNESPEQFAARLENYLLRWVQLAGVEQSFNGIKDLLIREQFINASPKLLALFLKERQPKNIKDMAVLAGQYIDAHRGLYGDRVSSQTSGSQVQSQGRQSQRPNQFSGNKSPDTDTKVRTPSGSFDTRKCYYCKKTGHVARDCFQLKRQQGNTRTAAMLQTDDSQYTQFEDDQGTNDQGSPCTWQQNPELGNACVLAENVLKACCCTPANTVELKCGHELQLMSAACRKQDGLKSMPVETGKVEGKFVSVLRDSGCSTVAVRKSLVSEHQLTGHTQCCVLVDGTVRKFPVANIYVETPFFSGRIHALCMDQPVYDLIIGNIPGAREPGDPDAKQVSQKQTKVCPMANGDHQVCIQAVQTRAERKKEERGFNKLKVSDSAIDFADKDEFQKAQDMDPTLNTIRDMAKSHFEKTGKDGKKTCFYYKGGLLYRKYQSPSVDLGKEFNQVVVPMKYREQVLKLAHDSIFGGHLGAKKTSEKVLTQFYWPGLGADTTRFCRSCDVCQRTFPKGRVTKVPLGNMPLIQVPFERVAVDLVGPIHPVTDRKNRYILTMVDYATRYPEAAPLPGIEAERVAETLVEFFTRVGVPKEILTDLGSQFTSEVMKEVSCLLSLKQLKTSPYHPACNGLVERFNGSLKQMLKRMCAERPSDWDRYLPALLFAYREAPQESLGFSPFDLLYARTVRGPLAILKELWTKEESDPEVKSTYQYVLDLRERLEETCSMAREELLKSQSRYKKLYDRKTRARPMKVGEKVLVLLPTDRNKLLMQWKGPFTISEVVGSVDYKLDVKGKNKIYHANLLKRYIDRHDANAQVGAICEHWNGDFETVEPFADTVVDDRGILQQVCLAVIDEPEQNHLNNQGEFVDSDNLLKLPSLVAKETTENVVMSDNLTIEQRAEIRELLHEYADVFTDLPGRTNLVEHDIRLTTNTPVRMKPYPLPHALRETVKDEVKTMLDLGVIEPSDSPYASPIVLVKKPDGSNRFCIDFRKVNSITEFDAEPLPDPEEIFSKLSGSKYFTKIDLTKGYWQIMVKNDCRKVTAFTTPDGLYQFRTMPFGLVCAPATFSRMMRKLLKELKHAENFLDDILIHTKTWEEHMKALRELFERLRRARLTARPSKCFVGFPKLGFLGHNVGEGELEPMSDKIDKIRAAPRPETKKQVRSFMGLAGYYRKFIPNFATISCPLTDLTRKGTPNKVQWGEPQEKAFNALKMLLSSTPILRLPDLSKSFVLRSDASDVGVGSVLLQEDEQLFPIAYASRKLLPRERNYSVIEKECLAIVWAIQKFHTYLYGREFTLQTDH